MHPRKSQLTDRFWLDFAEFEEKARNLFFLKAEAYLRGEKVKQGEGEVLEEIIQRTAGHEEYEKRFRRKLNDLGSVSEIIPATIGEVEGYLAACERNDKFKSTVKAPGEILPLVAIDCEMVGTKTDDMALARMSVVDVSGETVIDLLVLPAKHLDYVEDYREHVTGLNKEHFLKVQLTVAHARKVLACKIDEKTIIVGHAVDHDLLSLGISHQRVIDTALLYPVYDPAEATVNKRLTHSLEYLVEQVFSSTMDRSKRQGVHDSVEDAHSSLQLMKNIVRASLQGVSVHPVLKRSRVNARLNRIFSPEHSMTATIKYLQKARSEIAAKEEKEEMEAKKASSSKKSRFTEGYRSFMRSRKRHAKPTSGSGLKRLKVSLAKRKNK